MHQQYSQRKVLIGSKVPQYWDDEDPSASLGAPQFTGPQSPSNTEKNQSQTVRRTQHKRQRSHQLGPVAAAALQQPSAARQPTGASRNNNDAPGAL